MPARRSVVDISPLPAIIDPEAAAADGAPLLFEEHGSNVVFETGIGLEDGDPLEGAAHVAECRTVSQRLAGVPMETNGCVAIPGADGQLTVWIPSQNPVAVRDALAAQLGMEASSLRVAAPMVGGGFGPKAGLYTEHVLISELARALGRPVKWTESRSENMVSMVHGRGMVMNTRLGTDADGTFVGLDVDVVAEAGAYPGIGAFLPVLTQMMSQGVYNFPKIRFHAISVVTNTTSTAAYRGAGRPEATQMLERVIDVAADELGIDPAEIRRRNFLAAASFPLTTLGGANYDCGEYEQALDAVLAAADYPQLLADQAARRESGDAKQLGIGLSAYVEVTAPIGLHVEYGKVAVGDDGKVTGWVGTSAHGQGHITAFSMIISDMLGVPMEDITIVQSDTDDIPRGAGTMGSRSLQTAGSAVHIASETVLDKAKQLAGHLLEANADDIVVGNGGLHVAGVPANALSWAELAQAAGDDARRPAGMEAGLAHELDFDGTDSTFPFGCHIALVEVDTETGEVELLRHVAVDDCGRILNPLLVRGQQHGGIAQGAAQALYEIVSYDSDGNPITSNLADYAMPSAAELPMYEASNTETPIAAQPDGRQGHRRVGHHRIDTGDPQRGDRRRVAPGCQAHRHAAERPAGVGGAPGRRLTSRSAWSPAETSSGRRRRRAIASTNWSAFAATAVDRYGAPADAASDVTVLHRWSIEDPGTFWAAIWDLGGSRTAPWSSRRRRRHRARSAVVLPAGTPERRRRAARGTE